MTAMGGKVRGVYGPRRQAIRNCPPRDFVWRRPLAQVQCRHSSCHRLLHLVISEYCKDFQYLSMPDVVSAAVRSRMMAGIRGKDTRPEIEVRRGLHARGFRFRKEPRLLPGHPDIVLTCWRVAVFVHGCFWHRHGCELSKTPASNQAFWEHKLATNQHRDVVAQITLLSMGWRVAVIWECGTRSAAARKRLPQLLDDLAHWIRDEKSQPIFETSSSYVDIR
jgi:DNA mismatch endonuclease, patch repair protein